MDVVGAVTFLLADTEGWPTTWGPELVEPLEAAAARHGGNVGTGTCPTGAFVAAFSRASDALAAALEVQVALHREAAGDGRRPRLRIALNTGTAEVSGAGQYVGDAINRGTALRAIAHGGQVVVSSATRDLAHERLPEGVEIIDLGMHRLRDLGLPEHVFELGHPDLLRIFPPVRSLDTMPNNLPGDVTRFVGRREELSRASELLATARLLTLVGAGGCGKTRIALQAAAEALEHKPDGVWLVELARLEDANLLSATVLAALGLREVPGLAPSDLVVEHLATRTALLVLDNCEHLSGECAAIVGVLVASCPSLTILATSRSPLDVADETLWRVPSMSLPGGCVGDPVESLRRSDAASLFVDRARLARPNFEITTANASAVAQIVRDLDGIPLAIELAAAWIRVLTPEQIAQGLGSRVGLLERRDRAQQGPGSRHETLEASLDWSHDLLGPGEQTLLRRLSVFAGGWTLDAAEDICAGGEMDRYELLGWLSHLVDKSLVATVVRGAEMRYLMLRSVQRYALARLADASEVEATRTRHLAHFARLGERTEPRVMQAVRSDPVLAALADEVPNLSGAIEWGAATDPDSALRLAARLSLFWLVTGRYGEGETAYARALEAAGDQTSPQRALVLASRAILGVYAGNYVEVPGWAEAAMEIGAACGEVGAQARAHDALGLMVGAFDPASGRPLLERSIELAREAQDGWCLADALQLLAWIHIFQDRFDAALLVLEEAYVTAGRLNYRWGVAWYWLSRARIAKLQGHLDEALQMSERMAAASHDVGDPVTRTVAAAVDSWIAILQGRDEVAWALASGPLAKVTENGAGMVRGFANLVMARVAITRGDMPSARHHLLVAIDTDSVGLAYFLPEHLAEMATLERLEGNLDAASARAEESLDVAGRVGSGWQQSCAERALARLAMARGEIAEAERYAHAALANLLEADLDLAVPDCLDLLAVVAVAQESFEEAARLFGAASSSRQVLGIVRFPREPAFWAGYETTTASALGEAMFEASYAAGQRLAMHEAVAYARRARGERKRPSMGWGSLTPTELEVVRHVAAGSTNRQIGDRMFISPGTVKIHTSHIFSKLGISNRSISRPRRHGEESPA